MNKEDMRETDTGINENGDNNVMDSAGKERDKRSSWVFEDDTADFSIRDKQLKSDLFFPLANEAGIMSDITPMLAGDCKAGQSKFLLTPVSVCNLKDDKSSRNFWVKIDDSITWSVSGKSAAQECQRFDSDNHEDVVLKAGFLWQSVTRTNRKYGISAKVTNFVPVQNDLVELMKVTLTNTGNKSYSIEPVAAIPIYARSADNIRDHRHVTSLLNRVYVENYGVMVEPTLIFDEHGHRLNTTCYGVQGVGDDKFDRPVGFYPTCEEFEGDSGSLEWPYSVVKGISYPHKIGEEIKGKEAMGGLAFRKEILEPGQSVSYVLIMSITDDVSEALSFVRKYGSSELFDRYLAENKNQWSQKLSTLDFDTGDADFEKWMKWVALQTVLRRIYGCSFLPYHDYGKGGRGWRDLWQDCTALMLSDPIKVGEMLFNNYAGVRFDGSNATIIGKNPGEFIADRNNIARVWMDHGAWPYQTTRMYLDITGDIDFLFREQTYFKDGQWSRSKSRDDNWNEEYGNQQMDNCGQVYRGTILEHIILENVTMFYNIGSHGNIRLEGADWNDAFDLASENGESVAFTSFYAGNLTDLGKLIKYLNMQGIPEILLADEIASLVDKFDFLHGKISAEKANEILENFFESTVHGISGNRKEVGPVHLADVLIDMGELLKKNIRDNEWVSSSEGYKWINGYYDDHSDKLEGEFESGIRMTLTGQTFSIMYGDADNEQVADIIRTVDRYLWDEDNGGARLNTDFREVKMDMGRCFGFAYGTKENGSVFCHMAIMYANALYRRGFVREGYRVLDRLYRHSCDYAKSGIYPGIPEYFDISGKGAYTYLTGAASWLLITVLNEAFGLKGDLGDLIIEPKLVAEQFSKDGKAATVTLFGNRNIRLMYENPKHLDYGHYVIDTIEVNGKLTEPAKGSTRVRISSLEVERMMPGTENVISVRLAEKRA